MSSWNVIIEYNQVNMTFYDFTWVILCHEKSLYILNQDMMIRWCCVMVSGHITHCHEWSCQMSWNRDQYIWWSDHDFWWPKSLYIIKNIIKRENSWYDDLSRSLTLDDIWWSTLFGALYFAIAKAIGTDDSVKT